MKVLILWADAHSANLGVRVLAEGTAALARQAFGPDTVVEFQDFASRTIGTQLTPRVVAHDVGRRHGPIKQGLRGYDVVLDTGAGDSFTDIYGLKRLIVIAYVQHAARRVHVPVVLTPQTLGPFETRRGRLIAAHTLRRATQVMSRDQASTAYATRLGRAPTVTATDVVFALPQPVAAPGPAPLDVILNVSGLLWHGGPHVDAESYRRGIRGIIDALLGDGRHVTLLAHVLDNPSRDKDSIALHDLTAQYGDRLAVSRPQTLDDARATLARAHVVIGSRMHACLNALSVGTPAIALAYSRKFAPLLSDFGWPHTIDLRSTADIVTPVMALVRSDQWMPPVATLRTRGQSLLAAAATSLAGIR